MERPDPRPVDSSRRWVVPLALAMVAAQLAFRAWAGFGGWFRSDDLVWLAKLHNDGLTAKTLFGPYASHLMPLGWLLSWLNINAGTFAYAFPASELLTFQAIADLGAIVFLVSAFGRRPGILPPLALFLSSVITLPAFIWWAPGVNQVPTLAVFFWGGWAHLRYLRSRRLRDALLTILITGIGLGFAEKTLLVFLLYAFLPLAYFAQGDLLERMKQVWVRYRVGVVMYAVVAIAYTAYYIRFGLQFDPGQSNQQPLLPMASTMGATAYATALLGGPFNWQFTTPPGGIANPGQLVTGGALALLAVLVWQIAVTRERSGRAWVLALLVLGSDIVLVASSRANIVGPLIGREYRYITETAASSAIALALATMPLLGAVEQVAVRRSGAFVDRAPRVLAATLAVVALGTYSSWVYVDHWHADDRNETYYQTLRSSLAELPGQVPVVESPIPEEIVWGLAYPDNLTSRQVPLVSDRAYFPEIANDSLYMVDNDGRVGPATIDAVRSLLPSDPTPTCPAAARNGVLRLPLDGPVIGYGWWARVEYAAAAPTAVHVVVGETEHDADLHQGLHSLFFYASGGTFDEIRLTGLEPGVAVCVSSVELGRPQPLIMAP